MNQQRSTKDLKVIWSENRAGPGKPELVSILCDTQETEKAVEDAMDALLSSPHGAELEPGDTVSYRGNAFVILESYAGELVPALVHLVTRDKKEPGVPPYLHFEELQATIQAGLVDEAEAADLLRDGCSIQLPD